MRYILHIQTAQRKSVGAPVPIHRRGLTETPCGPSEIISGTYQTAEPEIVPENQRAAAILEIKEQTAAARARFQTAKLIGLERPPSPEYQWAKPANRVNWEDWQIPFGESDKPSPKTAKPTGFLVETGAAFFPTGKLRVSKDGESKPEMKPAGKKAVVTIGERVFSVITRSKRIASRFGESRSSVTLSQALRSITRMVGEEAAKEARAAFLEAAPSLE